MFGGIAFLLMGRMFCGVVNDDLMVRVGPEAHEASLAETHVRPMDFTGRAMIGYVFVGKGGTKTVQQNRKWIDRAASFVVPISWAASKSRKKPGTRRR